MINIHVWPYIVSEDTVWFSDCQAGGLYTYHYELGEVCNKIKPDVLFQFEIYEVAALACWKSFIFVFSNKLSGTHIIYDSLKDEIKRLNGLENENQGVIHQAVVIGEILYLIPSEIKEYIYAIDLSVWNETSDSIKLSKKKVHINITMRTWLPKSYGRSLYIPEYKGKRVFCIVGNKCKQINLDIPDGVFTIGVFGEELWAAPLYGKYIFCLTMEGEVKQKVKIPCGSVDGEKSIIWEIIARDDFVFFLHYQEAIIDIYHRKSKKIIRIDGKKFELSCYGGPGDEQYFLPYVMKEGIIRFLPSRCSMLEIDLSNFMFQKRAFGFPTQISKEEWSNWCKAIRKYRQKNYLKIENEEGVKTFVKYVSDKSFLQKSMSNKGLKIGRNIYQNILEKEI